MISETLLGIVQEVVALYMGYHFFPKHPFKYFGGMVRESHRSVILGSTSIFFFEDWSNDAFNGSLRHEACVQRGSPDIVEWYHQNINVFFQEKS